MLTSKLPAERPRALALSVALALIASVGEVVVRFTTSPEIFGFQQLALAIASNIAALGLLTVLAVGLTSIVIRAGANVFRERGSHGEGWLTFVPVALVAGVLVSVTNGLGLEMLSSTIGTFAGVSAAALVTVAMNAPSAMRRVFRLGAIRNGLGATWLICGVSSVAFAVATHRHLDVWRAVGQAAPTCDSSVRPNFLLVVLDTLRYDRVGVHGGSDLTPNLDRLATSSIVYHHAMSTAPWTLPTHASLFTGLYPHEHGVSWGHYELESGRPVLAELLKDRGYQTFAVSNNWLVSRENGFGRGFDLFLETATDPLVKGWRLALQCAVPHALAQWLGLPGLVVEDAGSALTNWVLKRHLETLTTSPRPFFGFINYFEPHDPYLPPKSYLETHLTPEQRDAFRRFKQNQADLCAHACGLSGTFSDDQIDLMADLYDAEVAYQDAVVGELVETLEELKLLENTWLVVTSDHGELFGESDMVFHTAGSHYQLLHVPLIVRPPGGIDGRTVNAPVQPVDIFRSLVEWAGATVPPAVQQAFRLPMEEGELSGRTICVSQTFGASIVGLSVAQFRDMQKDFSEWLRWVTSVYADGYMLELDERGPRALYDVREDEAMEHNLVQDRPDVVRELASQYRQWTAHSRGGDAM